VPSPLFRSKDEETVGMIFSASALQQVNLIAPVSLLIERDGDRCGHGIRIDEST
jgi:hypothetical protein